MQAHPKMIWLQVSVHNTILKSYGTNIVGMGSGATHRLTKELAVTLAINDEHRLRTAFRLELQLVIYCKGFHISPHVKI